jgi:hypothetical protein
MIDTLNVCINKFIYIFEKGSSCGRLKNLMCTSFVLGSFKPRLRLAQETPSRTKKMHFLALIHK